MISQTQGTKRYFKNTKHLGHPSPWNHQNFWVPIFTEMFELPHQSRHLPQGRSSKNQQIWRPDRETWTNRKHKTSPFCLSKIMLEANLAESCCPVVSHIFFAQKTQMPVNIDPAKQTFGEFKIFCNCFVFIWNSCECLRVEPTQWLGS